MDWDQIRHFWHQIQDLLINLNSELKIPTILRILLYSLLGFIVASVFSKLVTYATKNHISAHHSMLSRRVTFYAILLITIMLIAKHLGFDLSTLMAGAGIGAAAVAFASQTGISNVISGFFLIGEKPFIIGDVLQINDVLGEVLSVGLLSISIRTRDNTLVRIPNEMLLKSQFQNISRFPIRRLDIRFKVSNKEDIAQLREYLLELAAQNSLCLETPNPELQFVEFSDIGLLLQFSVWAKQSSFFDLKTELLIQIQEKLKQENIDLPTCYLYQN
ncbi:MAG: mechanosensitive ion channel family protein [Gammaproteobacteria bacterium]